MNFTKKLGIAVCGAFLITSQAHAVTYEWSPDSRRISYVRANANGIVFKIDGASFTGNKPCSNTFQIYITESNYEHKAAVIMTAFATQDYLKLHYDSDLNDTQVCTQSDMVNFPQAIRD